LRVTAVEKREYAERTPDLDEVKETGRGEKISLKAYVHHLTRTITAFEWDLNANVAMLQITQLQRDGAYEEVAGRFFQLVSPWLDIERFGLVDLRQAIRGLHEIEERGNPEARSHGVHYRSPRGRTISAHSPTPRDSVVGEKFIDEAMESVRKYGVGHLGNFYWQGDKLGLVPNAREDVHFIIVGAKSRVNFPTPNTEEVVRHVLQRVRAIS